MGQPNSHIQTTRTAIGRFLDAVEELTARGAEYAAIGGSDALDAYFTVPDPENPADTIPRVGLDITKDHFVAAITTIQAIETLLSQGHATNLYRVRP